jgi:hypothetical protein
MPTYFARKAGNINAADVWATAPGGTASNFFPAFTNADVLVANSFVITINVDTTVAEVRNDTTGGATAQGYFDLLNGVLLKANVFGGSSLGLSCCRFNLGYPSFAAIEGNITGGPNSSGIGVRNGSSGSLNITGNCTGGVGDGSQAIVNGSTGILNIVGNCTGNGSVSGNQAHGALNSSTGTINITGDCTGGVGGATPCGVHNSSTGTVFVNGNATGGSQTGAFGANNASTGTLTVTGICTGGTTNGAAGANNASNGILNAGRAKGNDFGIGSSGIASGPGVVSVQASITRIKALEYGLRGQTPTSGPCYLDPALTNVAVLVNYPSGAGSKTLSDPLNTAGLSPATNNVRFGVVYNNGNSTGSCAVPAAASTAFGVPVDNTTGTAVLTPEAVWGHASRTITEGGITAADVWNAATRTITGGTVDTLTNAPSVPTPSQIASQVRTELSVELGRVDAAVSSRATAANIPAADITAIKSKTDALPASPAATGDIPTAAQNATAVWSKPANELTVADSIGERAKQQSTVAITGAQLAAALS